MPKKIGICINVGGRCPKALSREKQEVDVTNFKCAHCGGVLKEYKDTGFWTNTKSQSTLAVQLPFFSEEAEVHTLHSVAVAQKEVSRSTKRQLRYLSVMWIR